MDHLEENPKPEHQNPKQAFNPMKTLSTVLLLVASAAFGGEAELLAILKSETASRFEKSDACRQLAIIGTKAAVPTLAALLTNEELSHMARYALEPIKDPTVDAALRDALTKTSGNIRAGIIHSLGLRRDTKAVPLLIPLLPDPVAALALARIGTPAAIAALEKHLPATAAACLIAAETKPALYEKLITPDILKEVRIGAMAGAIRSRGAGGIPLLIQQLHSDDPAMFGVALRLTREWKQPKLTAALAAEITKLPSDRQELFIRALGDRGDRAVVPALLGIRNAASIQALVQLRAPAAVPMLVELALSGRELANAAQNALAAMPGREADNAVLALLENSEPKTRLLGISLLGQRRVRTAVPALLKATNDPEPTVRNAAVRALGELAGAKEFSLLIDLLLKAKTPTDAEPVESALTAVCIRETKPLGANVRVIKALYGDLPDGRYADVTEKVAAMLKAGTYEIVASNRNFRDPARNKKKKLRIDYDTGSGIRTKIVAEGETISLARPAVPAAMTEALCAAVPNASGPAKISLLRVLRSAGGAQGLAVIRNATTDADTEVRETALRSLCEWPTPDALPDLVNLARTASDAKFKILALRGWLRLAPQTDAAPEKQVAMLKEAAELITREEEQQLLLSSLGQIASPDALAMVLSFLDTPRLRETANMTAVNIAEKLVETHPAAVAAALERVKPKNKRVAERAEELLERVRKAAK
ncbi:MAG: HEAT repeat domain-containing protein [Verrucomicrobiae bacterium]|nr:HEAT repeat domain-containing protein [Verrucomicrobiae bacterium]